MTQTPARPAASARSRLRAMLALMVIAAIAPIAGLIAWQVYGQLRDDGARMHDELRRSAAEFAQAVNRELGSSIDALTVLSQSEIFQQGRIAAMGRLLERGRPRRDWDSIFLVDPQGNVVLDTAQKPATRDALQGIHALAMKKLAPVVATTQGTTQANAQGIAIAMPIMQGGHALYVLGARMNDAMWPRLAANAATPEGGQARLYDGDGRLIGQSGAASGKVYGACADAPISGWRACVALPADPIDQRRRQAVLDALSTSGVALLVGLVLAAIVGRIALARLD